MSNGLSNARRNLHGGAAVYRKQFETLKSQGTAASEQALPGPLGEMQRLRASLKMVGALRAARKAWMKMRQSMLRRTTGYAPATLALPVGSAKGETA